VTSDGIIPALYELVGHICRPDEKALFLTPSYAYFKHAADFNERQYVCSDLVNADGFFRIDFDDLARKAADRETTLLILCHPHNPTGRVWTEEELRRLGGYLRPERSMGHLGRNPLRPSAEGETAHSPGKALPGL